MGHENSKNDWVNIFLPIKWAWGYQTITSILIFFKTKYIQVISHQGLHIWKKEGKCSICKVPLFKICACLHLR